MTNEQIEVLVVGARPGRGGDERAPERQRRPHLVPRARPDRRALAHDALGLPGRQRTRLARPLPGHGVLDVAGDAFATKDQVAAYFEAYAEKIAAPIRTGVEVTSVTQQRGPPGFPGRDLRGALDAAVRRRGHRPLPAPGHPADRPGVRRRRADPLQRLPQPMQLPEGNVLVVGAGSSGVQIADELQRPGARSTSRSGRTTARRAATAPRLLLVARGAQPLGPETPPAGAEHVTIAVSGPRRALSTSAPPPAPASSLPASPRPTTTATFREDLAENISRGDANYLAPAPGGRRLSYATASSTCPGGAAGPHPRPGPGRRPRPVLSVDLAEAGITSIVGPPASRLTTAGSRSTPSTSPAAPRTVAASPPSPASTFPRPPLPLAAAPASSGGVWHGRQARRPHRHPARLPHLTAPDRDQSPLPRLRPRRRPASLSGLTWNRMSARSPSTTP